MKHRTFNSVMTYVHSRWAAEVLGMTKNSGRGADLIDDEKQVELKFKLTNEDYSHKSWRVLEYQMNYGNNGKPTFWGLGFYTLDKPIRNIGTRHSRLLESHVTSRELYIVEWDWMKQFQSYVQQGKTETSTWKNELRFPKFRLIPPTIKSFEVNKGLVHITKGVPEISFAQN